MKLSLAFYGLVAMITLPALGSAGTLTWNFLNDVPTGSAGVAVASPYSFTDTQMDATTITASIAQSSQKNNQLFEKNGGGDEVGLGIYGLPDNEIGTGSKIKLDLNSLLALNPTSISITLGSVQTIFTGSALPPVGEGGFIEYGVTSSGFNVSDENAHPLNLATLSADGGYLEVYATAGNLLIANVTALTPASQAPEPANAAFVGIGLLALASLITRRKLMPSRS